MNDDDHELYDTFASEEITPPYSEHWEAKRRVAQALRDLPNTVLLPHVGSATVETRAAMGALTVDNLLQHLKDGTVISAVPECAHL